MNRRPIITGIGLALLGVVLAGLVLLGLDVYARSRVERSAGTNWQGYRGPVAGRKVPGEVRIAVLGGSTAFGYGVTATHAFPAYLERLLSERAEGLGGRIRRVTVLNLAYNNESAVCFASTLESYAYLQPDIVLLYSGINDKPFISYYRKPEQCHRNKSTVFRFTGLPAHFAVGCTREVLSASLRHGRGGLPRVVEAKSSAGQSEKRPPR
jgi:hypothetical protein